MSKREYPLFLIDRSKHSTYPFDFIACFDQEVGFVARVIFLPSDVPYFEFAKRQELVPDSDFSYVTRKLKNGGIFLVAEEFLYHFEMTRQAKERIKSLLQKALKKYLHAEIDRTPKGFAIDDQIKQQTATVELAKRNYERLVKENSKEHADYMIALAEATLETLISFRDNQKILFS